MSSEFTVSACEFPCYNADGTSRQTVPRMYPAGAGRDQIPITSLMRVRFAVSESNSSLQAVGKIRDIPTIAPPPLPPFSASTL